MPERTFATAAEAAAAVEAGTIDGNDIIWVADTEHEGRYEPYVRTTGYLAQEAAAQGTLPREFYRVFSSDTEALLAYDHCMLERKKQNTNNIDLNLPENQDELDIHEPILVWRKGTCKGEPYEGLVRTTVGRLIFNDKIPQDLGFQGHGTTRPPA